MVIPPPPRLKVAPRSPSLHACTHIVTSDTAPTVINFGRFFKTGTSEQYTDDTRRSIFLTGRAKSSSNTTMLRRYPFPYFLQVAFIT